MKLSFAFFLLLLLGCTSKQNVADQRDSTVVAPIPQSIILDEYFTKQFPADEPGGSIIIMQHDTVVLSKGYGVADIQSKEKVTTQTLFNVGSITKTFVSNAMLMLQEQKKLSIDDNLLKYFPDFENKDIAKKVTIHHLLTHSSGLPDIRNAYSPQDSAFFLTAKDLENWAPIMKASKLNFESGSRYEYSNPAFNALALIIEQTSGMKWQQFVREKIMIPSGMNNSTITDGAHPQTGVAHAYILSKGQWLEKDYMEEPTFAASGNGGVWSSVEELRMYQQALKNAVFLPKSVIEDSYTIKKFANWKDSNPEKNGWSWFIGKTKEGYKTIGHTGSQGGFRANYVYVPEKDWFVVMLSGVPRPLEEYTERVFNFLQSGQ